MKKSKAVLAAGGVVIMFVTALAYAGDMGCGDTSGMQQKASAAVSQPAAGAVAAVNAGNKICPVSGEKIEAGTMQPATYEFNGKIYNFCCEMCIDTFKKDPAKYIAIVDEELKAAK